MSDQSNAPAQTGNPSRKRGRVRRALGIAVLVVAAGFAGAYANSAFSFGPGFGPARWHHGGMHIPFDPARAEQRADRMVRHLAVEVDASNEQQDKLRAIVQGAVKDLMPIRDKAHEARVKARELLTQPAVNRSEIERFRSEHVALADAASKRIAQAIGDAAEVLTAEQRRRLSDHFPPEGRFGPPWRRW
jgi:Spy/CpxP family protein refolding chaperone